MLRLHSQSRREVNPMKTNDAMRPNRRLVLRSAAGLLLVALPFGSRGAEARKGLRIGVIGSGRVGGTLSAGRPGQVMFSS
jgi:hypothetical protein